MKLLIFTQAIDLDNPALGFFHTWTEKLSKKFEHITVICLGKGKFSLPQNVTVLSLGKEKHASKFQYILNFYKYIWKERHNYDRVFVHMNQEYVLLGGIFWKLLNKKIFLWRNHPLGNFLTTISVFLSDVVFCTSKFSYTSRFKKTILMPVGINTDHFKNSLLLGESREQSVLFFGRIDPIKKPEIFIDALRILKEENTPVRAVFVGNFLNNHFEKNIQAKISEYSLQKYIQFHQAVPQKEAPAVLSLYSLYVNCTPTGSMDKAIFEAMACETLVLTSNKALMNELPEEFLFKENDSTELAHKLTILLRLNDEERKAKGNMLRQYVVEHHSLDMLFEKLTAELYAAR